MSSESARRRDHGRNAEHGHKAQVPGSRSADGEELQNLLRTRVCARRKRKPEKAKGVLRDDAESTAARERSEEGEAAGEVYWRLAGADFVFPRAASGATESLRAPTEIEPTGG
jgi:hypothetical protein